MRAIDGDALSDWMKDYGQKCINGERKISLMYVWKHIQDMPTIEPERKTGKWQKLYGYATPGGDPVWCCSECGKGIHVFGIEHNSYGKDIADHQWLSCPNCDAKMIGEEE